jgi:hypothetical protein
MLRFVKTLVCLALLTLGLRSAYGFALVGPKEAWQVENIGYTLLSEIDYPSGPWNNLRGPEWTFAPKNYNEWYRWSTPVLYYTYSPTFVQYFQQPGIDAVDSAFKILNSIPNVDTLSQNLTEYPLDEFRENYTANSLHLFDLKSATLEMMMPRMGLADPEYWTWCIRTRIPIPGLPCPFFDYQVIQRNFDPVTIAPSKFVNGNLFTYQFLIYCPPAFDRQDPVEFLIDPEDTYRTAVATPKIGIPNILYMGYFHVGLTRDDVGGLRYLYSTNRVAQEFSPPDAAQFQTNYTPTLIVSSNLTILAAQALTNDAPTLSGLYPGLVILNSSFYFSNVYITNFIAYFTNYPWDPIGTPAHMAFSTNVTPTVIPFYQHTFGNLYSISNSPSGPTLAPIFTMPAPGNNGWVSIQTTSVAISNEPWAPAGSLFIVTNTSTVTYQTNEVVGEYIILPTNLCSLAILYSQITFTNVLTNNLFTLTNSIIRTNAAGGTNAGTVFSYTVNILNWYTNHAYVVLPVVCTNGSIAIRQGVGKVSFVRHDYDDLLSRFFYPVTNNYSMTALVSNVWVKQEFQRIVTRPDFLIDAADLTINGDPTVYTVDRSDASAPSFSNAVPATTGPGILQGNGANGSIVMTFNQVGPVHLNSGPFFVDEASAFFYYQWGSFDGSTNLPTVYGGSSVADLAQILAINVSPSFLQAATENVNYFATLSVSGGQPPYSWALGPGSAALPPGLTLTQNPSDSTQAFLSGPPMVAGTYPFFIRVTDGGGRFVDASYIFTVYPQ